MKLYAIFENKVDKNHLKCMSTNQKLIEEKSKKIVNPIIYLITAYDYIKKISN